MVHVDEEGDTESPELHRFTSFTSATFMKVRKVSIVYTANLISLSNLLYVMLFQFSVKIRTLH